MNSESSSDRYEGEQITRSRRSMLTKSAAVVATGTAALAQLGSVSADGKPLCPTDPIVDDDNESEESPTSRDETFVIQSGTPYATEGVVSEAPTNGPTAVVIGGMHGNETAGYRAASAISEWELENGTVVVIPEANAVAVDQGTRSGTTGDLNRHFPADREPTSPLARELWDTIVEYDPDVVIDFHTSRGIWDSDVGPSGYGQAVFPTEAGRDIAEEVVDTMNESSVRSDRASHYTFTRGNTLRGARPMLIHKVGNDLDRPGFLLEVTQYDTSLETRQNWLKGMTEQILSQIGLES